MITYLVLALISLGPAEDPPLDREHLRDLIRAKTVTPRSLVFVYEGERRWVGDPKLSNNPAGVDQDFQGTFLLRKDGAALFDLYRSNPSLGGSVIRQKCSILGRRGEETRELVDAKQEIGTNNVEVTEGASIANFHTILGSPSELFPSWILEIELRIPDYEIAFDGWDQVEGRNCLRIHARRIRDDKDPKRDTRRYWVDLDRGAQVVKVEYYEHGRLTARLDQVRFLEVPAANGPPYWVPVHSRNQSFIIGETITDAPLIEQTTAVVDGSIQVNLDLPDSLLTVTRSSALPPEMDRVNRATSASRLRQKFEAQPPQPRPTYRMDPASVQKRIDENLAEANRQAKELEASSPARSSWTWGTISQVGLLALGVAFLGGAVVWKGRGR